MVHYYSVAICFLVFGTLAVYGEAESSQSESNSYELERLKNDRNNGVMDLLPLYIPDEESGFDENMKEGVVSPPIRFRRDIDMHENNRRHAEIKDLAYGQAALRRDDEIERAMNNPAPPAHNNPPQAHPNQRNNQGNNQRHNQRNH